MNNFLSEVVITRRLSAAYRLERLVAERRNCTLVTTARCLLLQSELSPSFWAEAINRANYFKNRCPIGSLNGKTPFEVWSGYKPDISNSKVSGSKVLYLRREPGKGKFE